MIRHWIKRHKAQNTVLQWQTVATNLKACGKYKYWIIFKSNKKQNSVANEDTVFDFEHVFYQQNQQPLDKLSNYFA